MAISQLGTGPWSIVLRRCLGPGFGLSKERAAPLGGNLTPLTLSSLADMVPALGELVGSILSALHCWTAGAWPSFVIFAETPAPEY